MLKKIRWYVKPFQYNMREHNGWIGTQTDGQNCYININGFLKDFLEMHNPYLSHQPPPTWAVTRLHKVFKKDGGVEQRSSLKTGPARPGHTKIVIVITAVDFEQFSLYSIGTMIVQGALAGYPSAFHCTLNTQVSYRISYHIVAILSVHLSVTFRCYKNNKHKHYGPILYRFRDTARYWSTNETDRHTDTAWRHRPPYA